jgi:hypothetical protein
MPAQTVIKLRRDTAANWTTADSVLSVGEPGLETDTGRIKFGDGATVWTSLAYSTETDISGKQDVVSGVSDAEIGHLDGVTSAIQTQIDAKAPLNAPTFTGAVDFTSATVTGIESLPTQTGETGNYLTTDGSVASWAAIDIPPGTTVSDTAPSTPDAGQLWWDSGDGTLYIYYDSYWVQAVTGVTGPTGATGVVYSTDAPIDTSVLWLDTDDTADILEIREPTPHPFLFGF